MKKFLFFIALLLCCQLAYATELTLQFKITGVAGKALKNITERLNTELNSLKKPLSYSSIQQFYNDVPANAQSALEPFGYFHSAAAVSLTHSNQNYLFGL